LLLFRFSDPNTALQVLKDRKINTVGSEELTKRLKG